MAEDLRLELRFKNARLFEEIEARFRTEREPRYGCCSLAATTIGIHKSVLNGYLTLRRSPWTFRAGRAYLTPTAQKIAGFFCHTEDPEELFPVSLYRLRIPRLLTKVTDSERFLSFAEARKQKLLPASLPADDTGSDLASLEETVNGVLSTLSPQQQLVIRLRFGIKDGRERTLGEIARILAVSRETIRLIQNKALRKLRHPSRSSSLRPFVHAT